MDWITEPAAWTAFFTLTALELVLGIDNIVFLSILTGKLPPAQRPKARQIGLALALGMRVLLLMAISWMSKLTAPLFTLLGFALSGRDLILFFGGLFLIGKSTHEIHQKLEGEEGSESARVAPTFAAVLVQIVLLDAVFSLDSVITAIGMADRVSIMIAAVIASMALMLAFARPLGEFVERHPTIKMLALSFLLLIGTTLMAEGLHVHFPKGYTYSAMAFSLFVEFLNLKMRAKAKPVHLHEAYKA